MLHRFPLIKIIAILGVVFIFFPIAWVFIVALVGAIATGTFTLALLTSGGLFPIAIIGIILLIIAAALSRIFFKVIFAVAAIAIVVIAGMLIYSAITGLPSGIPASIGAYLTTSIAGISVYWIVLGLAGIIGLVFIFKLFRKKK